jgi:hypothetical protein
MASTGSCTVRVRVLQEKELPPHDAHLVSHRDLEDGGQAGAWILGSGEAFHRALEICDASCTVRHGSCVMLEHFSGQSTQTGTAHRSTASWRAMRVVGVMD